MDNSLALKPLAQDEWGIMREQAAMLVKTGFLPKVVDTAEKAMAIMLKGRELGIPAMYALSNIIVIEGKPACNAELMLSIIYREQGDDAFQFVESTDTVCTASYKRRSWTARQVYSFTIKDAEKARLIGKDTWNKYPAAMLRARCISAVARMAFPDCIGGMYTPEELGATVIVTPQGDIEVKSVSINASQSIESNGHKAEQSQPPAEKSVTGEIERDKKPTPAMWKRWEELWAEAQYLGLKVDTVPRSISYDELKQRGQDLAAAINVEKTTREEEETNLGVMPS